MNPDAPTLLISESIIAAMTVAAREAQPNETGGILLGVCIHGTPWVTAIVTIPALEPLRNRYRIPLGATRAAVQAARTQDHRLGYLGDWHSHPSDVGHSATDLASLALITVKQQGFPKPTSIVLRRIGETYRLDARRISHLQPRRCHVEITGNLPVSEEGHSSDH